MKWEQLLSDRRFASEPDWQGGQPNARTDFERDYDRLIFSSPFRRLQNKTQVFPLPGNVFVHNRLTHSLEVSCVGRSLGNIVGRVLRERYGLRQRAFVGEGAIGSIVSAACLAHDLGNPPFGHSGERAIGAYFAEGQGRRWKDAVQSEGKRWEDFVHFEGNANALRLLTHQFLGRREGGFGLTYSTLASIIKYPYGSSLTGQLGKFGFFESEEQTMRDIAQEVGLKCQGTNPLHYARYPLVYLVEAADDICYQIMDLEDAYKMRILSFDEIRDLLLAFFAPKDRDWILAKAQAVSDRNEQVSSLRAKVINLLIETCASCFLDSEDKILQGHLSESLLMAISSSTEGAAYKACQQVAYSRIYPHRDVVDVELAGHRIFSVLIDRMMHALMHPDQAYSSVLLSRVSSQYDVHQQTTYAKIQSTLDYISGMTDIYALDLYRKITGMNLPAI